MKGLPKAHIATNPGEIAAHGKHVDLIAKTSCGSQQVRVIYNESGSIAVDKMTGDYLGGVSIGVDGNVYLDDQHNVSPRFDNLGEKKSFNVTDPLFCDNRLDRVMPNGMPDPRGTAMGGYNPR